MPEAPAASPTTPADVCLYVEGAYPYVRGGVSTWVQQILNELPDLTFHLVHIGAQPGGVRQYVFPSNLREYREIFLFAKDPATGDLRSQREALARGHERFATFTSEPPADPFAGFIDILAGIAPHCPFEGFWQHPKTWDLLQEWYLRYHPREVFVDYFWNVRFLIEPVWRILAALPGLPPARVHHSISTGYAGLAAAVTAQQQGNTFLLSEHGIYVRERIADLLRSSWSGGSRPQQLADAASRTVPALRRLWIDFFAALGDYAYQRAGHITSLFRRNAELACEFGAPAERIQIIPNGVKLDTFNAIRYARLGQRASSPARQCVGFLGRVSPIKDVKNLLRAARVVVDQLPGATFLIAGPTDEDPDYHQECLELTRTLQLEDRVRYAGPMALTEALPEFDVMALPSLSEGLPFALLECLAAEVPCVTTDVGACREIIEGRAGEAPGIGLAGRVVPPGDAAALGQALVAVLQDRSLQDQLGSAGRRRVEAGYTEQAVLDAYRRLYAARKNTL